MHSLVEVVIFCVEGSGQVFIAAFSVSLYQLWSYQLYRLRINLITCKLYQNSSEQVELLIMHSWYGWS